MLASQLLKKTMLVLITAVLALCLCQSTVIANSGYDVLLVPDIQNNSWAQLGTVVVESEPGSLVNGDLLMFRLSSDCSFYASEPTIIGPALSDTPSGQRITYTIRGDQHGQLRIVIPEWVSGNTNDLFTAAGQDPFYISSIYHNEVVMTLQNYESTFGENRFMLYFDESFAVADEYRSVRLYFEPISGSGWPANAVPIAGYDFVCPHAPTDLKATAISETQIDLSWQDKAMNEDGYKILMKQGTDPYKELAQIGADTIRYSVSDLQADTRYSFKVQAFNDNCISTPSNISSARTSKLVEPVIDELVFEVDSRTYYVNNQSYQMDTTPIVRDSRTLLPIRYIAESLGAQVEWNAAQETVVITRNETEIILWIGNPTAKVNGKSLMFDPDNIRVVPEIVAPGRTMVPLRFVAEYLGCTVDWDEVTREIKISCIATN